MPIKNTKRHKKNIITLLRNLDMFKIIMLNILIVVLIFTGCTEDSPLTPEVDQIVIQGFLYADEPVTNIRLTKTLSLGSQDTIAPPINDADVYLIKNDQAQYKLQATVGDSGFYHYEGDELVVNEGDFFNIKVDYFGRTATGSTEVPSAPENVKLSNTTLYIPELGYGFQMDSTRHEINVSWDKESSAMYYILMENVDTNPKAIETGARFKGGSGRFISAPVNLNKFKIRFMNVTHYGKYCLKVYRVNQEYADLYISRQQDSRDLNEPLTNIENGLGVFSAFNSSKEIYFNVVEE